MSVLALAIAAGVCFAQDTGKEVVDKVLAHYSSVKGASVDMAMEIKVDDPTLAAMMGSMDQKAHAVVLKPNKFALWPDQAQEAPVGSMPAPWVYCDGKTMTSAVPDMEMYEQKDAPASFAAMAASNDPNADAPGGAWQMVTGADVIVELMGYQPKKPDAPEDAAQSGLLLNMLSKAEYKGLEGEGADKHHVLLLTDNSGGQEMRFEVHIAAEGKPWLVALKPIMDEEQGLGGMSMLMTFKGWKPAETLPEAEKFQPKEDWTRVDDLMDAIMSKMMEDMPEEPAPAAGPAEGEPAVNFTLETLDGGSFTLADQMGKVVVLDFWATWCGPCVAGLPVVTEVTGAYKDKGVVFAAVNVNEDKDTVDTFMQDKKWDFRVALDKKGLTANSYGVSGIPHSVIIDKKGVVRHVHVGFGQEGVAEYKARLTSELDELIAE
jgi:thiol-disulfide isomerase/thioredoxin